MEKMLYCFRGAIKYGRTVIVRPQEHLKRGAINMYLWSEIITPRLREYQYAIRLLHCGHKGFSCMRSSHT